MRNDGDSYRDLLVRQVKALANDVDTLAPDLVGSANLITNFEIHLKFPHDSLPTIEVIREHIGTKSLEILQMGERHA